MKSAHGRRRNAALSGFPSVGILAAPGGEKQIVAESEAKPSKAPKAACPYCAEPVSPGAMVCKTCRRDIGLAMSLQSANRVLEYRVQQLEAEVARLQALVEPQAEAEAAVEPEPVVAKAPPRRPSVIDVLGIYVALPILALIAAHYLLVVRFDAKLMWLRAASIALPALVGWILGTRTHLRWYYVLALGVVVALASVFGMSTVIHYTDGDAILPDSPVAWRETFEYAASIALSYLLGSLIATAMRPLGLTGTEGRERTMKIAIFIVRNVWGGTEENKSLMQRIEGMEKLITKAVAASTAAGAVYTGFKGIF